MIELTDSPCQSSQGLYASGPATCRSKIRIPRCFTKQRTRIFSGGILRLHSVHASSCRLSFAHSQSSLSPCPLMCIKTSTLSMSTPNSAIHADLAQEARKALSKDEQSEYSGIDVDDVPDMQASADDGFGENQNDGEDA